MEPWAGKWRKKEGDPTANDNDDASPDVVSGPPVGDGRSPENKAFGQAATLAGWLASALSRHLTRPGHLPCAVQKNNKLEGPLHPAISDCFFM
jgi:hypothetical protein